MIAAPCLFSLLNFSTCADSFTLEKRDRVDDLICSHGGADYELGSNLNVNG